MRAVLISIDMQSRKTTTTDIVIGDDYKDVVNAIGNRCDNVTSAGYITDTLTNTEHAVYVDDDGYSRPNLPVSKVEWHHDPLVGNIVVTGFDPESGETIPATISGAKLATMIKDPAFAYTGSVH